MDECASVVIDDLRLRVAQLADGPDRNPDHHLHAAIARRLRIPVADVRSYRIRRRSIDARHGHGPELCYRLEVSVRDEAATTEGPGIHRPAPGAPASHRLDRLDPRAAPRRPLVVGTGPAGLSAALLLARYGCEPLVLDRGRDVARRARDLERFHSERILDPDSNYLYGEGGAGAYSDGKLNTGIRDERIPWLLDTLVAARAPGRIRYDARPHIGSDILPHVSGRLRRWIEEAGGSVRWENRVVDLLVAGGRCRGVRLANGSEVLAPAVILATGHSDRALCRRLLAHGLAHTAKGFQIGCRIEHPQEVIDRARYGRVFPPHLLGPADYRLVSRPPSGRVPGVASFCMCPGGEILAATPDADGLCTNGGSRHARASGLANAALIVTRREPDPATAYARLRELESAAFAAGGGDFTAPAQTAADFLSGGTGPLRETSYRFGLHPVRLDRLLPPDVVAGLREALAFFDRKLPGFVSRGQLVGIETRVSAPVRFERDPRTQAASLPGLYLAGEGAGQAGGIVSAAIDGLRVAEAILCGFRRTTTKPGG